MSSAVSVYSQWQCLCYITDEVQFKLTGCTLEKEKEEEKKERKEQVNLER